jgi:hypothetical protein
MSSDIPGFDSKVENKSSNFHSPRQDNLRLDSSSTYDKLLSAIGLSKARETSPRID